jgi:hypothetical protein
VGLRFKLDEHLPREAARLLATKPPDRRLWSVEQGRVRIRQ